VSTVYIVAAHFGGYEGWQPPIGVYSTEDRAFAAIGRALGEGLWCAQNLRVLTLEVDAALDAENPGRTEPKERGGDDA
jgi:hypothetical protein